MNIEIETSTLYSGRINLKSAIRFLAPILMLTRTLSVQLYTVDLSKYLTIIGCHRKWDKIDVEVGY